MKRKKFKVKDKDVLIITLENGATAELVFTKDSIKMKLGLESITYKNVIDSTSTTDQS